MDLYLRKVIHPQAIDNYRVILKDEGQEIELGSIGVHAGGAAQYLWTWGIDTVIPMRTPGRGKDRTDCMRQFKAAWERFAASASRAWYQSAPIDLTVPGDRRTGSR